MFENIFGAGKEKRTQVYFRDDGAFEYRKLEFQDAFLVEKKDSEITKGWKHFYSSELRFDGYKNIHADMVTLGFDRDFILDPFDKVPVSLDISGKPKRGTANILDWTSQVAESQRHKVMRKNTSSFIADKITIFLGITLILLVLLMGVSKAW